MNDVSGFPTAQHGNGRGCEHVMTARTLSVQEVWMEIEFDVWDVVWVGLKLSKGEGRQWC